MSDPVFGLVVGIVAAAVVLVVVRGTSPQRSRTVPRRSHPLAKGDETLTETLERIDGGTGKMYAAMFEAMAEDDRSFF